MPEHDVLSHEYKKNQDKGLIMEFLNRLDMWHTF